MSEPVFLGAETVDKTMKVVMALAREVYVLQDRLAIIEMKLEERGNLTRKEIDEYQPSPEEQERILKRRDLFIEKILQPVLEGPK